jgi:hypothetical protein
MRMDFLVIGLICLAIAGASIALDGEPTCVKQGAASVLWHGAC